MAIEENKKNKKNSNSKLIFKERFEIDFSTPLPYLDANNSIAYNVKDISNAQRELFVLIANNTTPARSSILPHLRAIEHSSVLRLVEYGVVDYLPFNSQNMAIIYEKPKGPKLLEISKEQAKEIIKDKEKLTSIVLSLLSAIETFYGFSISHRAIRPDNIFFKNNNLDALVLGDCASCFAGFKQPPAYETIEMGLCDEASKGGGSEKNDFYSAAASIMAFINQKDLFSELTKEDLVSRKLQLSSYGLYTSGDLNCPKWLQPFIKGLLEDEEINRWKYVQAYSYIKDKNYTLVKQYVKRVSKPLVIDNRKYEKPNHAAFVLGKNTELAISLIKSGRIADWIKHGFEDEEMLAEYDKLVSLSLTPEILVAKICVLIAPNMPIFYKNLRFNPQGISKAVFFAIKDYNKDLASYKEVFNSNLLSLWYSKQSLARSPQHIAELHAYIKNKEYGYGIERIIYEFDEDLPCISPLLEGFFVNTIGGILRALEKNINSHEELFDNAIIAFIRCKLGKKIDPLLKELSSSKPEQKSLSLLRLYIMLQNKYGPKHLYNVAKFAAINSQPIVTLYNKISTQQKMEKAIVKAAESGVLHKIYAVLDDKNNIDEDKEKYKKAVTKNIMLNAEKNKILEYQAEADTIFNKIGAKFCIAIAVLSTLLSLFINFYIQFL